MKRGFTLAEVLITLAIIGVVAAMTIPTLITKMSQKAAEARTKTIEARLLDGINRYSTLEDGLSQSYETTYDFLVGLSKHYKMAQICKADEITNCVPYSTINYTQDGEDKSVEVSTLTSIGSFISGDAADEYLAPASFITGQGTPVVMAFKKDCVWDSGKAMRDIADSGCIAYMYDENGTRNPNKIGKDWIGHGLSIIPPSAEAVPIATINGVKIMERSFTLSQGLALDKCKEEANKKYGITCMPDDYVYSNEDYWAAAMKYCHDKGYNLPTPEQAALIVSGLLKRSEDTSWQGYNPSASDNPTISVTGETNILAYDLKDDLVKLLDLKIDESSRAYYVFTNQSSDNPLQATNIMFALSMSPHMSVSRAYGFYRTNYDKLNYINNLCVK